MTAIILDFQSAYLAKQSAAQNTLAATWSELIGSMFDLWEDACMDALDLMQGPTTWERMEIVEAEHHARLIREVFE